MTKPKHKPIYFHADSTQIQLFDELVKYRRSTRSSILNYLIEVFVTNEQKRLVNTNSVKRFTRDKELQQKMKSIKKDLTPDTSPLFSPKEWHFELGR
jgi:hypothetical protein